LYRRYIDDEVAAYGAEMAYYFLLSVFPFPDFYNHYHRVHPDTRRKHSGVFGNALLPYESYELIRENVRQILNNRNPETAVLSDLFPWFGRAASGMGAAMRGINKALCQKDTRPFWIAIPLSVLFTILDYRFNRFLFCAADIWETDREHICFKLDWLSFPGRDGIYLRHMPSLY
jgi:membrane protein